MSIQNTSNRDEDEPERENSKLRGDWCNIILLTYIYILQCIPRGLAQAVPLILQKRKITYTDQAGFSLSQYPYCLKLLWSPIVDSVYSSKMGRRKTWLIPSQFLIGLMLLLLAANIDDWLGSEDGFQKPKTQILTIIFFMCVLFGSTHDIAVDGWSLTMLKKRNVGHQSTCNNVGFSLGIFLGYVVFLALDSKEFCNFFRSVPQDHGFIKFADFILFWSVVCLASTVLIWVFKRDNSLDAMDENDECRLGLKESYKLLWQILKLKPIGTITCIMLTHQVAFAPQSSVANLKLMDAGFPADTFALISVPSLPFIVLAPFVFSKYLTGCRSMHAFLTMYLCRVIVSGLLTVCIFATPYVKDHEKNTFPVWYHWTLLFIYNTEIVVDNSMWVSSGSFFSRVSDSRFGGMYMTLFNVITHIGVRWPISLTLGLVDVLTIRKCDREDAQNMKPCEVILDGYYTETIICSIVGIIWLHWARRQIYQLEKLTPSAWIVEPTPRIIKEQVLLASNQV